MTAFLFDFIIRSFYIVDIKWIDDDAIFAAWLSRNQKILSFTISEAGNGFRSKQVDWQTGLCIISRSTVLDSSS